MTQINPPFDGSSPCPMCSSEVRGVSALLHNFLVRWPEGKAYVKLNDLREFHQDIDPARFQHPDIVEMMTVCKLLVEACSGMTTAGMTIRWTPEITKAIADLVPRAEKAAAAANVLSEAHFDDDRHSMGEENILREQRGGVGIRFLPKYDYHYKVECVRVGDADIRHTACGTALRLDRHFKDRLARDPEFYGKAWCPTCRINAPWAQFDRPNECDGCMNPACEDCFEPLSDTHRPEGK